VTGKKNATLSEEADGVVCESGRKEGGGAQGRRQGRRRGAAHRRGKYVHLTVGEGGEGWRGEWCFEGRGAGAGGRGWARVGVGVAIAGGT
jgi:hypothetical protein